MKQLGLSPSETALIYGTMPFLGAIVRPLIGAIADKLHAHKVIEVQNHQIYKSIGRAKEYLSENIVS